MSPLSFCPLWPWTYLSDSSVYSKVSLICNKVPVQVKTAQSAAVNSASFPKKKNIRRKKAPGRKRNFLSSIFQTNLCTCPWNLQDKTAKLPREVPFPDTFCEPSLLRLWPRKLCSSNTCFLSAESSPVTLVALVNSSASEILSSCGICDDQKWNPRFDTRDFVSTRCKLNWPVPKLLLFPIPEWLEWSNSRKNRHRSDTASRGETPCAAHAGNAASWLADHITTRFSSLIGQSTGNAQKDSKGKCSCENPCWFCPLRSKSLLVPCSSNKFGSGLRALASGV